MDNIAIIKAFGVEATLKNDFLWHSEDDSLERVLNAMMLIPLDNYSPNEAIDKTLRIVDELGAKLVWVTDRKPFYEKETVKGGKGSGHFGHRGRPGKVGGSRSDDGVNLGVYEATERTSYHGEWDIDDSIEITPILQKAKKSRLMKWVDDNGNNVGTVITSPDSNFETLVLKKEKDVPTRMGAEAKGYWITPSGEIICDTGENFHTQQIALAIKNGLFDVDSDTKAWANEVLETNIFENVEIEEVGYENGLIKIESDKYSLFPEKGYYVNIHVRTRGHISLGRIQKFIENGLIRRVKSIRFIVTAKKDQIPQEKTFDIEEIMAGNHIQYDYLNREGLTLKQETTKGGEGSGNFGHRGRPGLVGGSGRGRGVSLGLADKVISTDKGDIEKVREWEKNLPEKVKGLIDEIIFAGSGDFEAEFHHACKETGATNTSDVGFVYGFYYVNKKGKRIIVLRPTELESHFHHEVGHAIIEKSKKRNRWYLAYRNQEFDRMTWYSKTNVKEGFCETFVSYMASGGKVGEHITPSLADKLKDNFRVVDEVLAGL